MNLIRIFALGACLTPALGGALATDVQAQAAPEAYTWRPYWLDEHRPVSLASDPQGRIAAIVPGAGFGIHLLLEEFGLLPGARAHGDWTWLQLQAATPDAQFALGGESGDPESAPGLGLDLRNDGYDAAGAATWGVPLSTAPLAGDLTYAMAGKPAVQGAFRSVSPKQIIAPIIMRAERTDLLPGYDLLIHGRVPQHRRPVAPGASGVGAAQTAETGSR